MAAWQGSPWLAPLGTLLPHRYRQRPSPGRGAAAVSFMRAAPERTGLRNTCRTMPEESTTPDLVELVHRVREAVNRRDFDAVEDFCIPDAAYRGPEIGSFEGAAAIRGLLEDFLSAYQEFHAEADEVSDIGNGVTFGVTISRVASAAAVDNSNSVFRA